MSSKLVMGFVVEALDGRILDGAVHPLDLTIGARVLGLGQAVIAVVAGARYFEGRSPEWLRLYLFVAIDRTSKFAFTELHGKATRRVAADFLLNLIKAVPYKIHTVLTDNGTHFTDPKGESWSVADIKGMLERGEPFWAPAFEVACARNGIDHRLTKPKHPWTNG